MRLHSSRATALAIRWAGKRPSQASAFRPISFLPRSSSRPLQVPRDLARRKPLGQFEPRFFCHRAPFQQNSAPSSSLPASPLPQSPGQDAPAYEMTFTCKKCQTRSTHRISKQGYHHGTVLVQCPGCKNRHLISDHLKIFSDTRVTLEDILKEKGQLIKTGTLSTDGDVEFWDDGTRTDRDERSDENHDPAKP